MSNTEVISMLKMDIYLSLIPTPPPAAPQILFWMGVSHGWALLAHQMWREVLMGNTGSAYANDVPTHSHTLFPTKDWIWPEA